MTGEEFEAQWRAASVHVERACRYALSDPALSSDVVQQVAIRAWRGSASFRGDCPFTAWVQQIARNEINRAIHRLMRQRARDTPLEEVAEGNPGLIAAPAASEPVLSSNFLRSMLSHAAADGALTGQEAKCVLERLNRPEASWEQIGALLGITGSHSAVVHCRAIPKLRAYMFVNHRDQVATPAAVAEAVKLAASDPAQPLTAAEEEAFRRVVIDDAGHRQPVLRNLSVLRSACNKVIRHLSFNPA
jgi:DNA-directed RNA polymerase specialized sigma24 family protein